MFGKRPDTSAFVTREEIAAILPWVTRAELHPQLDSAAIVVAEGILGFFEDNAYALTRLSAVLREAARETTSPAAAYLLDRLATAIDNDGELPRSPPCT